MDKTEIERYLLTGSCLAGAYMAYTCPCYDPFLNCHSTEFLVLTGLPFAYVLYTNWEMLGQKK
jgi:hypothetical protein